MNVTFGVCADLHTEFIHDAPKRMEDFLNYCKRENVDFCVNLGDFCPPGELNAEHKKEIFSMIKSSNIPFYHVLGNHDMDENSKDNVLSFLEANDAHTSFDFGGVHFVVLDACHFRTGNGYESYDNGNYKYAHGDDVPFLPPSELDWLEKDLSEARYPAVVFSHQSLIESRSGIRNPGDFRNVIKKSPNGVIMAMCGHEHVDRAEFFDGVWYVCINSMSYYWAGENYQHETYGEEIEKSYPLLKMVFPYKDSVFTIVEVSDESVSIKGKQSEIVGALPEDMNFKKRGFNERISASIENKHLRMK